MRSENVNSEVFNEKPITCLLEGKMQTFYLWFIDYDQMALF